MKNRNHEYLYTVDVRCVTLSAKGDKVTTWAQEKVNGCNIHEVAGKLHKDLNDIRYITKEIIK